MASESKAISTFLRLRPTKAPSYFGDAVSEAKSIEVDVPDDQRLGLVNNKRSHWNFQFSGIIDQQASQDEVFERVAQPVVASVMEGFNGTVFAYGQTGSGKTYTLTGGPDAYADRGIIPRTLTEVFKAIEAHEGEAEHTVRVSYLEIYNEHGFDLLDPRQAAAAGRHAQIGGTPGALSQLARIKGVVEDDDGSVRLQGLSSHVVASEESAINLLFLGDTNRAVSETTMNAVSSRSHCIFTIQVEARPHGSTTVRRSKLHLVDLAGSERVHKSGASGTTLNEAININGSLHFLELVILALHEKQKKAERHVPYRNSLLTSVLRDSLGGNCKTVMVATVHPAVAHTDESISTCKFAQRVAQIRNEVSRNEVVDHAALIQRLREENRMLREAGGLADDDGKGTLTPAELRQLHAEVRAFVADADPRALVQWGRTKRAARVRHAMWILKGLLLEGWRPHHAPPAEAWTTDLEAEPSRDENGAGAHSPSELAGELEAADATEEHRLRATRTAWTDGDAPPPLQPPPPPPPHATADSPDEERRRALLQRVPEAPSDTASVRAEEAVLLGAVESAYELFSTRYEQGAALTRQLRETKATLRAEVARAQGIGQTLRAARDRIASLKAQVEARRVSVAVASVLPPPSSSDAAAPDGRTPWHVDGILHHATSASAAAAAASSSQADTASDGGDRKDVEEVRLCAELQQAKLRYHTLAEELTRAKQKCASLQARADGLYGASEVTFREWWPLACDACGVSPVAQQLTQRQEEQGQQPRLSTPPAPSAPHGVPREAWSGDDAPTSSAPYSDGAAAHLAMLEDPETALGEFRRRHWDADKARARDALKQKLHEAYAGAKEAGELVARKRASVAELKQRLAQVDTMPDVVQSDIERLCSQLQLDTTLYKGAVGSLRELKSEIEGLQGELSRSQDVLQKDFQAWHTVALAEARGRGSAAHSSSRSSSSSHRLGAKQMARNARSRDMAGTVALRDGTNIVDVMVDLS